VLICLRRGLNVHSVELCTDPDSTGRQKKILSFFMSKLSFIKKRFIISADINDFKSLYKKNLDQKKYETLHFSLTK